MKKYPGFIATLMVLMASVCSADAKPEDNTAAQLLRLNYQSTIDNSSRQYFVYLPAGYQQNNQKKWPLMLFLHGNGERGNGLDELDYTLIHGPLYEAWIQKRDLPFIIVVPQLHMFDMGQLPYIANRKPADIPKRLIDGVPPGVILPLIKNTFTPALKLCASWVTATCVLACWNRLNTMHGVKYMPGRIFITGS